ncbi:MAG: hypothetical protein LBP35_05410 [Candidatus Ancillula trichonymphae]|nr:hypothetical protein [Candidatus Ancillula trichonymphae]
MCAPAQVSAEFAKQTQLNGVLLRKTPFNLHSAWQNSVVFRSFLLFSTTLKFILNNSMWYNTSVWRVVVFRGVVLVKELMRTYGNS